MSYWAAIATVSSRFLQWWVIVARNGITSRRAVRIETPLTAAICWAMWSRVFRVPFERPSFDQ